MCPGLIYVSLRGGFASPTLQLKQFQCLGFWSIMFIKFLSITRVTNMPHPLKLPNYQHQFTNLVFNFLFAFSPWGCYNFSVSLTMHFKQCLFCYYLILISVCCWRFSGSLIICNVARHRSPTVLSLSLRNAWVLLVSETL